MLPRPWGDNIDSIENGHCVSVMSPKSWPSLFWQFGLCGWPTNVKMVKEADRQYNSTHLSIHAATLFCITLNINII